MSLVRPLHQRPMVHRHTYASWARWAIQSVKVMVGPRRRVCEARCSRCLRYSSRASLKPK
jgi:hypothetical protein